MSDPTQSELAALAAKLATGTESTVDDYHRLAERALRLWKGAGLALGIEDRRDIPERLRAERNAAFRRAGIEPPEAGRYFTLAGGLAFLMPKKRDADRMKKLRDFIAETADRDPLAFVGDGDEIPPGGIAEEAFVPKATDERVSREMERLRKDGFSFGQFCGFAERFLPWLLNHASKMRRVAGETGGKARVAKKKPRG